MTIINHKGELFLYRGREEFKDNNMSSFKFTPTDDFWPLTRTHYPQVSQPKLVNHFPQNAGFPAHPSTYPTQAFKESSPQAPNTFDIFNAHIRPDLVNSRLRLGPSALRSAIDGASTSPTRVAAAHGLGGLLFGQNNSDLSSCSPKILHEHSSDMNPSASTFIPSHNTSSSEDSVSPPLLESTTVEAVNTSLAKALHSEREKLAVIQASLNAERQRRVRVENEVTRLNMSNKSLVSSVNLLGSLIKQHAEKASNPKPAPASRGKSKEDEAVTKFYATVSATNNTQASMLHDALKVQREVYEYEADSSPAEEIQGEKRHADTRKHTSNTRDPFDLQLLRSPDSKDDSDGAALSRTLRKHFLNTEDSAREVSRDESLTTPKNSSSGDCLVEISPEELSKMSTSGTLRNQIAGALNNCRKALDKTKTMMYPTSPVRRSVIGRFEKPDDNKSVESDQTVLQQSVAALCNTPMLSIPASILSKYGKPPAKSTISNQNDGDEGITSQRAEYLCQKKDKHTDLGSAGMPKCSSAIETSQTLASPNCCQIQQRGGGSTERNFVITNDPFHCNTTIQWVVNANNGIFDDETDQQTALRPTSSTNPHFWYHPVRYLPNISEQNLYRTVMIDFIPIGSTYNDVLQQVRGGLVESIQLFGPIGTPENPVTQFMTARIVFVYEAPARNLYMRDQEHGIEIKGWRVRVWQVLQPTYPRNTQLQKDVSAGYTRMLLIVDANEDQMARIPRKLASQVQAGFLIKNGRSWDGYQLLEFTSIAEACKAMRDLVTDPGFSGIQMDFDNDPCSDHYPAMNDTSP